MSRIQRLPSTFLQLIRRAGLTTGGPIGHRRTTWHRLWRQPLPMLLRMPWPLFLLSLAGIFLAEVLVFALAFQIDSASLRGDVPTGMPVSVAFALQNFVLTSLTALEVTSTYGFVLGTLELVVGLITTSVITGLVFLRFIQVDAPLRFSRRLCLTAAPDGHLFCRFITADPSHWLNVSYGLFLFFDESIEPGLRQRRVYPLALLNPATPQLHRTGTLCHTLDAGSPLARLSPEALRRGQAALMALVEGTDEVTGSPLLQVQHYGLDDLCHGYVFEDLVREDADGRRWLDPGALDRVRPLEPRT